ncbi:hypothetical protein DL991_10750 [Amycolatopsis sp. WAC 01375]|uniref:hypothetical protein n=1 Tax=Amycolatopsis sp. WAC 01375 TaxID=2203194 RepID=UPI000F781FF0|nr:hypothetical protein [Amycolatopsis sp. WAC 01375]RSM80581.1 hypothetical protein DL991_10750 [Amycolatopsis sp. WAC 01375]
MISATPTGHAEPWWENAGIDGLVIHLRDQRALVPAEVAAMLLDEQGITSDAGADLLRLDSEMRDLDKRLAARVAADAAEVARCRREYSAVRKTCFGRKRRARDELDEANRVHGEASMVHAEVVELKAILRSFVVALAPREGLLAEAAAGWVRSSAVPAGVSVFEDVRNFLADTRREAAPDGLAGTIGGEDFGDLWRREGDDPVEQPLARTGCWLVGYIKRTREIYAVRRCDTRTREVWLLGRGFSAAHAHDLLTPLTARMQEPNSLILVANEVVGAAHEHNGGRA